MSRSKPSSLPAENLIPLLAGLFWIHWSTDEGFLRLLLGVLPGTFMLSGAASIYLLPGDLRAAQLIALGGCFGVIACAGIALAGELGDALLLAPLAAASFVVAGWTSQRREPRFSRVPEPPLDLLLASKVALDQLALASMVVRRRDTLGSRVPEHASDVAAALELFRARGWLDQPASYHETPPPLESPTLRSDRVAGQRVEQLSFTSGFEPHAGEPGRERWLGYRANRTAYARVLRHGGDASRWLICLHGYGMGNSTIDFAAFEATRLKQVYGLNLLLPVLPLHGPRKLGWRSGEGYLAGDFVDTIHAHAQAAWEARRLVGWLRAQGATAIGVYGLSLGAGVAALLACLEQELSAVVLGIPAVDLTRVSRRQASPAALRAMDSARLSWADIATLLSVVSPLALSLSVPRERCFVFAGTADHLISPDQVRDLWRHWKEPRIAWYAGSHLSFRREHEARLLLDDALRSLGAGA